MRLSEIKKNRPEFQRRVEQCVALSDETVEVNDGVQTSSQLNDWIQQDPVDSDWQPLYDAAGKFS